MYIIQINVIRIVSRILLDRVIRTYEFENLKNKIPLLIIVSLYIKRIYLQTILSEMLVGMIMITIP